MSSPDATSCQWEILVIELEAVRPGESVSCDEARQCGVYFAENAMKVSLALNPDSC
jgi:hypothetical protein